MLNRDVNHFYLKWSGYKTPNNKTPNATERPITKRPTLKNA